MLTLGGEEGAGPIALTMGQWVRLVETLSRIEARLGRLECGSPQPATGVLSVRNPAEHPLPVMAVYSVPREWDPQP